MNQEQRLDQLIAMRLAECDESIAIPASLPEKKRLFRALMNVRPPYPVTDEFLALQDAYLQYEKEEGGVVSIADLTPVEPGLYVWRGDITRLAVDAIVNAANSALLGCFVPCHGCIDNAIHSKAGVQLRLTCQAIMEKQGHPEPAGQAKLTPGFNLPARYVLHTVGPIVRGAPSPLDREQLASCYRQCLALADRQGLGSVAFCSISTGEFHFPPDEAADIAIQTVKAYQRETGTKLEVIFDAFTAEDEARYRQKLGATQSVAR